MRTGSTVMRVVENPEGGWDVREPGKPSPVDHVGDLTDAVRKAGTMMLHGGSVRIVNREGFLIETRTVPPPGNNSWSYLAPRPMLWALGVIFALQGGLGLTMLLRDRDGFRTWPHLLMGLLGVTYLVLLIISLRRDRRIARSWSEPQSQDADNDQSPPA